MLGSQDSTRQILPDRWVVRAVVLSLILLILRLPLLGHPIPVDPDEVNFVGGLGFPRQYPVHHPGYPLWVAMGTALNAFGLSPYASLQMWSLAASVIAPVLMYFGLRRLIGGSTAWWISLGFGVNPLVWFEGTTALSYMVGGMVGIIVVGLCFHSVSRQRVSAMYAAAAVLAVGISLRADLLIYLGPMLAFVAWRFRWRSGLMAMAILAVGFVAFSAWTSYLYGRADPQAVHPRLGHTFDVILNTSVFRCGILDGLVRNLGKIAVNLGWDFGVAVVLLPWAVWRVARRQCNLRSEQKVLLLLWAMPILLFLALMHVVQGYFVLLVAAGYCILGLAIQDAVKSRRAACIAAIMAVCSVVQFVGYPWSANSSGFKRLLDAKIAFISAAGLRQIDQREQINQPGDYWRTPAHDAAMEKPSP